ncbi:hypothetical protein [Herpetosiphon sp.]|uniref:hypothetical protein n=1 Tax=Herpetosiphon sp. TaxID=71864 RepID=UPI0002E65F02|nr:hypothetical protein [Herpetosiphon sp.]
MLNIDLNTVVGSLELSDEELEIVSAGAEKKSYSCTVSRGDGACTCTCGSSPTPPATPH